MGDHKENRIKIIQTENRKLSREVQRVFVCLFDLEHVAKELNWNVVK